MILLTRSRHPGETDAIALEIRQHNDRAPILRAGHRRIGFRNAAGAPVSAPRRAVVFCAIGNPGAFREDVEAEGSR